MRDIAKVAAVASKQHGVVSRQQVLALGIKPAAIQRALGTGLLELIHAGVYRLAGTRIEPEARLWAALLLAGDGAVLSHRSAGWHWRLEGLGRKAPTVIDVTIPARRYATQHPAVDVRRTRSLVLAKDYATLRGIPCTGLARTLVDLSSILSAGDLEHAYDSAVRRDAENRKSVVEAIFRLGYGRPGTVALAEIADREDYGCTQSWLENEVRQVLRAERIPTPLPQLAIRDDVGVQIGIFDFAWPQFSVVLMVDSWEFHKPPHIFEKDRKQSSQLSSIGWHPVPITYRRLMNERAAFIRELKLTLGLPV